jgi:CheY-like chemotaxis protein
MIHHCDRRAHLSGRQSIMARIKRVLGAISDHSVIEALDPLLSRATVEFSQVANGEACVVLASTSPYDLILAQLPLMDMSAPQLLTSLRAYGSPSLEARILLLASSGQAQAAEALRYRGIDKVALSASMDEFRNSVAKALGIALRSSTRVLVNLHVDLGDSLSTQVYETENLSRTGMLVRTAHPLAVGTEFEFDICLAAPESVLQGTGYVVRHTVPDRESVHGMGVEFSDLARSSADDLDLFVKQTLVATS